LEELLKLNARLGKTPFTAMGVTKNYVSMVHIDRDVLHAVISWFIQSIFYFYFLFLLFPFYEFSLRFKLCLCEFFARDVADTGKFVFPGLACSFDLD
jgi:hypothetical protein